MVYEPFLVPVMKVLSLCTGLFESRGVLGAEQPSDAHVPVWAPASSLIAGIWLTSLYLVLWRLRTHLCSRCCSTSYLPFAIFLCIPAGRPHVLGLVHLPLSVARGDARGAQGDH